MAVMLSRGRSEQLHVQKFKDKDDDDDEQHIIDRPTNKRRIVVPVVYYLCRNGQLEHPHFMEVPLSSSQGLFLRDVILRLNLLRGKSMPSRYSWSSKRSYKNGYVWHDLSEDDFIHPVHGGEYVLKGSEILSLEQNSASTVSKFSETQSSSSSSAKTSGGNTEIPRNNRSYNDKIRRRNQSWGAIDLHEYKVYKSESTHDFAGKAGADASTQTEEKRRRSSKKSVVIKEEHEEVGLHGEEINTRNDNNSSATTTELSRDEISPPPSDSSPETLETLMKADGRLSLPATLSSSSIKGGVSFDQTVGSCPSGRMKASSVLMSLISCGSISFRDCGVAAVKDHGFTVISQYKNKVPRSGQQTVDGSRSSGMNMMMEMESNVSSSFAKMALEDKEYFSGSLIETTNSKQQIPSILKRSSSYNADRNLQLKLEEKEVEGVRARCLPRRPKIQATNSKKDGDTESTRVSINNNQDHISCTQN